MWLLCIDLNVYADEIKVFLSNPKLSVSFRSFRPNSLKEIPWSTNLFEHLVAFQMLSQVEASDSLID